jgi:hypothetical protein
MSVFLLTIVFLISCQKYTPLAMHAYHIELEMVYLLSPSQLTASVSLANYTTELLIYF